MVSLACALFYKNYTFKKKNDIPLITIYNFSNMEYTYIVTDIMHMFKNDSYFAVVATNSCIGVVYGLEYIPQQSGITKALRSLCATYNPDVLIYGIDVLRMKIKSVTNYEKYLKSDIEILILDNVDDGEKFSLPENEKNETILFFSQRKYSENVKAIPQAYLVCTTVSEVYKNIISLFEKYSEATCSE
jgi:hypothetical protein